MRRRKRELSFLSVRKRELSFLVTETLTEEAVKLKKVEKLFAAEFVRDCIHDKTIPPGDLEKCI